MSLSIDRSSGEQVVPLPRVTDNVGNALRAVYPAAGGLPDDIAHLLSKLSRPQRPH